MLVFNAVLLFDEVTVLSHPINCLVSRQAIVINLVISCAYIKKERFSIKNEKQFLNSVLKTFLQFVYCGVSINASGKKMDISDNVNWSEMKSPFPSYVFRP